MIGTETLFTTLLVLVLYCLVRPHSSSRWWHVALAGLAYGLAVVTRPVGIVLIPVLILVLLWQHRPCWWLQTLVPGVLAVGLVLMPWLVRNYRLYKRITLSTIGGYNLLFYNASSFIAHEAGVPFSQGRDRATVYYQDYLQRHPEIDNPAEESQAMSAAAWEIILKRPIAFAWYNALDSLYGLAPGITVAIQFLRPGMVKPPPDYELGTSPAMAALGYPLVAFVAAVLTLFLRPTLCTERRGGLPAFPEEGLVCLVNPALAHSRVALCSGHCLWFPYASASGALSRSVGGGGNLGGGTVVTNPRMAESLRRKLMIRTVFGHRHLLPKLTLILIGPAVGAMVVMFPDLSVFFILVMLGLFLIGIPLCVATRGSEGSFLLKVLIVGFLVRVLLAFLIHPFSEALNLEWDAAGYEQLGWKIAQVWRSGRLASLTDVLGSWHPSPLYIYFNALIYTVLGHNLLAVRVINSFLGTLTGTLTYFIAKRSYDFKVAKIALVLTTFFPSMVFWSTQNLKDTMVVFLVCLIVWAYLKLRDEGFNLFYILFLVVCPLALTQVRPAMAIAMVLLPIAAFFLLGGKRFQRGIVMGTLLIIILGLIFWYLGYGFLGSHQIRGFADLGVLQSLRRYRAVGGSAFGGQTDVSTIADLLRSLPESLIAFLLRPWPWEARSLWGAATVPEVIGWYILFPCLLIGLVHAIRTRWRTDFILWGYVVFGTLGAAPQYGNLGTAYRHRMQLLPFYLIFAALGIALYLSSVKAKKKALAQQLPKES